MTPSVRLVQRTGQLVLQIAESPDGGRKCFDVLVKAPKQFFFCFRLVWFWFVFVWFDLAWFVCFVCFALVSVSAS